MCQRVCVLAWPKSSFRFLEILRKKQSDFVPDPIDKHVYMDSIYPSIYYLSINQPTIDYLSINSLPIHLSIIYCPIHLANYPLSAGNHPLLMYMYITTGMYMYLLIYHISVIYHLSVLYYLYMTLWI